MTGQGEGLPFFCFFVCEALDIVILEGFAALWASDLVPKPVVEVCPDGSRNAIEASRRFVIACFGDLFRGEV